MIGLIFAAGMVLGIGFLGVNGKIKLDTTIISCLLVLIWHLLVMEILG